MRSTLLAVLGLLCSQAVLAQVNNAEFDAIAKKFEKGSFVSALETAEALIDNDKHKKKPEPYLWAAMCFYELSKSDDPKIQDVYKAPLRDALKFAGKAVSKDKNSNIVDDNADFFNLMKKEGIAAAQAYEKEGDYRKASYTYKQIMEFAPSDPFVRFVKGVTDIRLSSLYEAGKEISVSFAELEKNYMNMDYKPDPISSPMLKDALLYYVDHLVGLSYVDSARNVLQSSRVIFPLSEELKTKLQDLN